MAGAGWRATPRAAPSPPWSRLPYGLALARLMGLPPELGLFTSIVTAPVTSLLGRNPVLIGGTASATVPFIAAAVRAQGIGGAAKVCLAASVFMMIFCVLRLGRYVAKVPHAVVSGFSCGVGAMMVILQLRTLLGLPASPARRLGQPARAARQGPVERHAVRAGSRLLLGLIVIAGAIVAARRWPRSPAALLGVGLAVAAGYLLGWHERLLGDVALTVPPFAGFTWTPDDITDVLPSALGLGFRHLGQHPDHVARRRALPGPAPTPARGRRRRRAGRLRDRQPLRGRLRGTDELSASRPAAWPMSAVGERRGSPTFCTPCFCSSWSALARA